MTTPSPSVLLANEPLAYREVLAMAIAAERPGVAVRVGDPAALDAEIARWHPSLIVSSATVDPTRQPDATWLQLYPGGARFAVTARGACRETVGDLGLDDLLALVDVALADAVVEVRRDRVVVNPRCGL